MAHFYFKGVDLTWWEIALVNIMYRNKAEGLESIEVAEIHSPDRSILKSSYMPQATYNPRVCLDKIRRSAFYPSLGHGPCPLTSTNIFFILNSIFNKSFI